MFACLVLPQPILGALPRYLSAFDLNRLHDVFATKAFIIT